MSQNLSAIEFNIDLALRNIGNSPLLWKSHSGAPADDPGIDAARDQLAKEGERLKLALRSLKTHSHRNALELTHARRLPRTQRYGAMRSIGSRDANLRRIYDKAKDVERRLREAYANSLSMHPYDAIAQMAAAPLETMIEQASGGKPLDQWERLDFDMDVIALSLTMTVALIELLAMKWRSRLPTTPLRTAGSAPRPLR